MRLDKFLVSCGLCSRREAAQLAKAGRITQNGTAVRDVSCHIDPACDEIVFCGERVQYSRYVYVMLNKPAGYVSATDDPKQKTVLELLGPREQKLGLFPCGRLDKDTVGLMILTNNGQAAHRKLSPRHHAEKEYRFRVEHPLCCTEQLEQGVRLDGGYVTSPCRIQMEGPCEGVITLTEGKYHQIKRMMEAVGNRIVYLERISFAGIDLDPALARGQWRYLREDEVEIMEAE